MLSLPVPTAGHNGPACVRRDLAALALVLLVAALALSEYLR
jgi:hypothetical protein